MSSKQHVTVTSAGRLGAVRDWLRQGCARITELLHFTKKPDAKSEHEAEHEGSFCAQFWYSFAAAVLVIAIAPYLFGAETGLRAASRVIAPALAYTYSSAAHDGISVALEDDVSLDASSQTWPPTYAFHAHAIDAIAARHPSAIFVDILFLDMRPDPTIAALVDSVCRAADAGIPVYMAADVERAAVAMRPELLTARDRRGAPCVHPVSVVFHADRFDRSAWGYPLEVTAHSGSRSTALASAAFAIEGDRRAARGQSPLDEASEHDVHVHTDPASAGAHVQSVREDRAPDEEEQEMALIWGSRPAKWGWAHQGSMDDRDGEYCRRDAHWYDVLLQMSPRSKPLCVYHETFRVADLRGPDAERDRDLTRLIGGRVVMLGTALMATGDYVNSPLHGTIPGVYLHAMALDNLMTYGPDWKRLQSIEWSAPWRDLVFFFLALAGTLTIGLVVEANIKIAPYDKEAGLTRRRWIACALARHALRWVILGGTALLVVVIAHWGLDLGPLGYIELTLALLTGHFLHLSHKIKGWCESGRRFFGRRHGDHA